jgi:hypothetical protein
MSANLQTGSEPSVTSLVTGIVNDAQELIKQQLALFKHEIRQDVEKAKDAARSLAFSAGLLLLGVVLLCFMLVHLLNWLIPQLPLWACYGIVGGVLAGVGVGLFLYGRQRLAEIHPLSDQAAEGLKENLEWTTKPR